jgi:hypothetical protein
MALARRTGDEDSGGAVRGKERGLRRNNVRRERAVSMERRMNGGNEFVKRLNWFHQRLYLFTRGQGLGMLKRSSGAGS